MFGYVAAFAEHYGFVVCGQGAESGQQFIQKISFGCGLNFGHGPTVFQLDRCIAAFGSFAKIFYNIVAVLIAVQLLEKGTEHHAYAAVVALVLEIVSVGAGVEVSTSLVGFDLTVAADRTTAVEFVLRLLFEFIKSVADES
jgi:hypothetical protein